MKKEIWRPIKGYETYYEVSNYGNVRSVDRLVVYVNGDKHFYKGKIMKSFSDKDGYLLCNLNKNRKHNAAKIHRLVAQAFLPNLDNLPQVNHKDENKANNCVFVNKDGSVDLNKSNLEWCDGKYNVNYGTARQRSAEKHKILLSKPVLQIEKETNDVIAEYPSAMEAARQLNIYNSAISKCCKGKRKTAYGFKWKYKE